MKRYISKEIAKKLHSIGYWHDTEILLRYTKLEDMLPNVEMYEVQDWFRDRGIILTIDYAQYAKYYLFYIYMNEEDIIVEEDIISRYKNTYYEALEAGILRAIEIYESNYQKKL